MSEHGTPCVPGLFTEEDGGRLLGARCTGCNTPYFPRPARCHNPRCAESRLEDARFGGRGRIWSWSVADFAPPPPHKHDKPFKPYAIAVVDLDDGLRLVGQMAGSVDQASVGAAVKLVIDTLYHEDGKAFSTWKFQRI